MSDLVTDTGATFSECGTYRYDLWRKWDSRKPSLTFIMLNPSTADDLNNDPTVERCQRRAIMLGYGSLHVANLMAYRSTNPKALKPLSREDREGPGNKAALNRALNRHGIVICGWGKDGALGDADWIKAEAWRCMSPLYALKINKDGSPQHPLYVSYETKPIWFAGAHGG